MKESRFKKRLRRIARWHAVFSTVTLALYATLSAVYSPEFLLSDVRGKFRAFADDTVTITATVLAPPVAPVVTATPYCNTSTGALSVNLDWADDTGSDYWDIDRDSLPLVANITSSSYVDTAVAVGTGYTYVVTAYGPMGSGIAVSAPVVVTTPSVCAITLPVPTATITAFDGRSVGSFSGTPRTDDRRPIFEGTTNIPDAGMTFLINDSAVISAAGLANAGGYFSWRPPVNLSRGTHILFVTATDPGDVSRTVSISFVFRIVSPDEDDEDDGARSVAPAASGGISPGVASPQRPTGIPVDFSLSVGRSEILQGEPLPVSVTVTRLDDRFEGTDVVIRYSIIDNAGNEEASLLEGIVLRLGRTYPASVAPPKFLAQGTYRVRAELILPSYNVSREASFSVLPLPVLDFGGGATVTYPELLSGLGRIALLSLVLLLLWLLLFSREYWLYLHSLRHITERHLARLGFFGGRGSH